MTIKKYLRSEDGAVTVDWVVMTGGVVGLGLATTALVSGGVSGASNNISGALGSNIVSGFFAATSALNATSLWNDPNATSTEFANVDQLSFSTTVTFGLSDSGILFEAGGTGRGLILYQYDGMLYLQAGVGSGTGPSANRGEASWAVTEGVYTIEGSMDADNGLSLYVNGNLVDESSFTSVDLAGSNPGSVGGGASSVAVNRGSFNANSEGHPGVTEVVFYEEQTIS